MLSRRVSVSTAQAMAISYGPYGHAPQEVLDSKHSLPSCQSAAKRALAAQHMPYILHCIAASHLFVIVIVIPKGFRLGRVCRKCRR